MAIDQKIEYLTIMLNKRTNRKKYENFIINSIYSKINNPDLIPVTQQCVIGKNNKHYLLDLYFPQINYGVEVDEPQHGSKEHQIADILRAEDIIGAIQCEEKRIIIDKKSFKDVCEQIDDIVRDITDKIEQRSPLKWLSYEEELDAKRKEGCFKIDDTISYQKLSDIYNFLGHNVTGLQRSCIKLNNKYFLWSPILSIIDDTGKVIGNDKYHNWFSEDKTIIFEEKVGCKNFALSPREKGTQRVVFMNHYDPFGKRVRKFVGVYKFNGVNGNRREYVQTLDNINFNDLMPNDTKHFKRK